MERALGRLREVADGVLVATARRWQTTSTVVVGDDGSALVVDPALGGAELEGLVADLRTLGLEVAAGFATHAHFDHVLWHAGLGDGPRLATPSAAAAAEAHRAALAAEARRWAPGADPDLAGVVRGLQGARLALPGREVVVLESDAHAPGHASCWLPDAGVLVAGDLCSDVEIPLLDLDGGDPIGDHRRVLERLGELEGVRVVVPGHGSVGNGSELARRVASDLDYLERLAAGRPFDDARLAGRPDLAEEHRAQLAWAARSRER